MKETEHHYFTPLGQCHRELLANQRRRKKGALKMFQGHLSFLFSKGISSTMHPFLLLINSLPHTPKLSVYQPPSAVFSPPFYHRLLSESLCESAGTADLSIFICSFPPAFASFFSELSHQQRRQRQLGVTSSPHLDTGTKNLTQQCQR